MQCSLVFFSLVDMRVISVFRPGKHFQKNQFDFHKFRKNVQLVGVVLLFGPVENSQLSNVQTIKVAGLEGTTLCKFAKGRLPKKKIRKKCDLVLNLPRMPFIFCPFRLAKFGQIMTIKNFV